MFLIVRDPTGASFLGWDKGGVSEEVPASRTGSPEMQLGGAAEAGSTGSPSPANDPRPVISENFAYTFLPCVIIVCGYISTLIGLKSKAL